MKTTKIILAILGILSLPQSDSTAHKKNEDTTLHSSSTSKLANPADFMSSVVMITKYLSEEEKIPSEPNLIGYRGTGWFYHSPKYIVTIEHITSPLTSLKEKWSNFELSRLNQVGESEVKNVRMRILEQIKCPGEDVVILELESIPFQKVTPLKIRTEPLPIKSPVFCLGYLNGYLRTTTGSYYGIAGKDGDDSRREGFATFELFEENNRSVVSHGTSGAPIFDDYGNVVGVVSKAITQTINLFGSNRQPVEWGLSEMITSQDGRPLVEPVIVSTPWYTPNVLGTALPVQKMEEAVR